MILFYMCFASLPYTHASLDEENEDLERLRAEISAWPGFTAPPSRPDLPDRLYDVLRRLLSPAPASRPSTAEILASATGAAEEDISQPQVRRRDSQRGKMWAGRRGSATGRSPDSKPQVPEEKREPERLLLPPPPSPTQVVPKVVETSGVPLLRGLVFAVKVLSLTWPCLPFAPRAGLLYPLLGLAAWEMLVPVSAVWVVAGLAVHLGAIGWAWELGGGLCAG